MRERVLTSIILAPVVLACVFSTSPWPIFALSAVVLLIALDETRRLLGHSTLPFLPAMAFLLLVNGLLRGAEDRTPVVVVACALFFVGIVSAGISAHKGNPNLVGESFDGLWPAMPLFLMLTIHQAGATGAAWNFASPLLLVLLPVWAGDIAAIFVGKAIGKHPMAPTISPKKTWEGAAGNLIAALAVGAGVGLLTGMGLPIGLFAGLAAGTAGQVGDLFESYVKRRAGVKDSGTLLPGHGGVLDRIDSILFTAPLVALVVVLLG